MFRGRNYVMRSKCNCSRCIVLGIFAFVACMYLIIEHVVQIEESKNRELKLKTGCTTPHVELQDEENIVKVVSVQHFEEDKRSTEDDIYEHLLNQAFPLVGSLKHPKPKFKAGDLKGPSDMIVGITTVKRSQGDYLISTLRSLISNQEGYLNATVKILVFIGETDEVYVDERSRQLFEVFEDEINLGKLQVISPPENYYPNWDDAITNTLGDSLERVKWRSKQNLDQVFLMMYIYNLNPTYYLMIEDDVITTEGYNVKILKEARLRKDIDYFYISFCELGAIGKLMRSSSLPAFSAFVDMFWNKQPLDWLQDDFVRISTCGHEAHRVCFPKMKKKMPKISPSLFQHMGKYSSLEGKLQPLKDKSFKDASKT